MNHKQDPPTKLFTNALTYLRTMLGENVQFREGQWECISALVEKTGRLLIVQRTGWGKSIVYFLATRLLRDQGKGPALLISPLLALMRNQIQMATRIGVRAATINSANTEEWDVVEGKLQRNEVDILLISPERLNNERFLDRVLPAMQQRIGLFVVDEVHCISDWGHDFRPDYRRIVRIVQNLPGNVRVAGVTATANDRVVRDVADQFGSNLKIIRGSLMRESLRLRVIVLQDQAERLAWLAENLPKLPGSGIIYSLTVADSYRVAAFLQHRGLDVRPYNADMNPEERVACEEALINNEVKALSATVALGMGFDKPDLYFVIHFQRPGSVVAYYQQVGRAGRAVKSAAGILLAGKEDDDIQEYFINTAFPAPEVMEGIVKTLGGSDGMTTRALQSHVNCSYSMLEKALKLLSIEGVVARSGSEYHRTANPWRPDRARYEAVTQTRLLELQKMREYVQTKDCLMLFLARELSDAQAQPRGRCANCASPALSSTVSDPAFIHDAVRFLQGDFQVIEPRRQWPDDTVKIGDKRMIPKHLQNREGRALCIYGDAGWGREVRIGKYSEGRFSEELVHASASLIRTTWNPWPFPRYVSFVPAFEGSHSLVEEFAGRLATSLGLPLYSVLQKVRNTLPQKRMANSSQQAANVMSAFVVRKAVPEGPCLLVDDIVDSRWTFTVTGYLISNKGGGPVYPFALAKANDRITLE